MKKNVTKGIVVVGILLVTLFLVGCSDGASPTDKATAQSSEAVEPDRVIEVESFQFGYEPSIIEVTSGERVRIVLTTRDVPHGLYIPELDIDVSAAGGKPGIVDFTAPAQGEYTFTCSLYCGAGHKDMRGKLIVR